jgi:cysteinyl-tRNA synthetase
MIRFTNTLGNELEEFKPIEPGKAKMYTCGPTVYNYAHVGNFRTYVFEDLLRRWLKYRGYQVTQVMNITDVEDKIIRDSTAQGITPKELTEKYTQAFFEDLDALAIERAEYYPKATEHVPEMVELIKQLREKGFVYESDGSLYYRIAAFPQYGKLSGIRIDDLQAGSRVDSDEYEKDDARDFVLWKAWRGENIKWETELGVGRPGWHIECSAMAMKYLGRTLDLHTGAEDNIFPHHENEIAQSEGATGQPFVHYWLHSRWLLVGGQKMSKSLGNFFTLRDLLGKGHDPLDIRFVLVRSHYRTPLDFTEEQVESAKKSRQRLRDLRTRLREFAGGEDGTEGTNSVAAPYRESLESAMDDDLNSAAALAAIFDMTTEVNRLLDSGDLTREGAGDVLRLLADADRVFGVLGGEEEKNLDAEVEALIAQRQEARKLKNYTRSDEIRNRLNEMGIVLEDTPSGVRWKRK